MDKLPITDVIKELRAMAQGNRYAAEAARVVRERFYSEFREGLDARTPEGSNRALMLRQYTVDKDNEIRVWESEAAVLEQAAQALEDARAKVD